MRARMLVMVAAGLLAASTAWGDDPAPDNTGTNVRDREPAAVTAGDQSEKDSDIAITQTIRKAVVDDDSLSTNAQNVKIITVDAVVTLRGPVETPKERDLIVAIAKNTVGVTKVDNQLEVAP